MSRGLAARYGDGIALIALTALLLPLYISTMYPDVVASGDSAKFQYLGRVLGTAHSPGYPTFVLVSHFWSSLPLGTLAWRMNLFSVVAALLTVVCTFFCARRLGAGVVHAALVGAALGVGRTFWEKALAAEVYSLGALLLTAALWRVLMLRFTGGQELRSCAFTGVQEIRRCAYRRSGDQEVCLQEVRRKGES